MSVEVFSLESIFSSEVFSVLERGASLSLGVSIVSLATFLALVFALGALSSEPLALNA
jgi:hypothetical protein